MSKKWEYSTFGIPDELFVRGNVPMTKQEVRTVTISKLRLKEDDTIIDIGAGTGSISIEAALISKKGIVYAVEKNCDGVKLISENIKEFGTDNIKIIQGIAPDILKDIGIIDKAIIGGTSGNMSSIFEWLDRHLKSKGSVVVNVITLENLNKALEKLKERDYQNIDVICISVSKGHKVGSLTMMKAQNPVYILSAFKK